MKTKANWPAVRKALESAKGICFDGCHKIYVLMDDEQVAKSESWGYSVLPVVDPDKAYQIVYGWYGKSCPLRFVNSVETVEGDPNDGYKSLIGQFDGEEDDYERDWDDYY